MPLAADHYLKSMTIRSRQTHRPARLPWWPISLWLAAMAALCAWKAVHYAEAVALLEFLSWPMSTTVGFWWGGAVLFGVLALAALLRLLSDRLWRG